MRVGLISVGREILKGRVLDTNSHFITRTLTYMGNNVVRISQIDDLREDIIWEIKFLLSYPVDVIITTGGLGPTDDDITIKSIADAFDIPCIINKEALNILTERYQSFYKKGAVDSPEITPNRKKMACFPKGATPLYNSIGAAPAMKWEIRGIKIFALPGVPSEMRDIFEKKIISEMSSELIYIERFLPTPCKDESKLGIFIQSVTELYPRIYIKSVPEKFGSNITLQVVIGATGKDEKDVEDKIQEVYSSLQDKIKEPC